MKILQLIQRPQRRGAELFAMELSKGLNEMGHQSDLAALFEGQSEEMASKCRVIGGDETRRLFDIKGAAKLASIIREKSYDIVQANAADTLKYAVLSKIIHGWKQPIVFRNASTMSLYVKSIPQKVYNNLLLRKVAAVASVSEVSRLDLINLFPFLDKKAVTLPNGIPTHLPKPDEPRPSDPVIVHVGGFTYEKNHHGLLNIYELVKQEIPNVKLWMLGDGPLFEEIRKRVDNGPYKEDISMFGFADNPLKLVQLANVLILPSIIEGLPGVVLEAFLARVPVVAFDVGGMSEVVRPETGFLVDATMETEFALTTIKVLNEQLGSNEMLDNAQALVNDKYSIDSVVASFEKLYGNVIEA